MTEERKKKFRQTEEEIYKIQNEAYASYLIDLKKRYDSAEIGQKQEILRGLESLAHRDVVRERDCGNRLHRESLIFSGEKAREIRNRLNLKQHDVVQILNVEGIEFESGRRMIIGYESGKSRPHPQSRSEFGKKYLSWLKKNGYNPFGI
jgi:DNA-binding transcriptional regulator YiaG